MNKPFIVPIDVGDMLWDHSEAVLRRGMGTKIKGSFFNRENDDLCEWG